MINKFEIISKIDDEEVRMLNGERFIKYIYKSAGDKKDGSIYIRAGLEAEPEDLLQSIFALIYYAYYGLKSNPEDADAAELLREESTSQQNSDDFWADDSIEMKCSSKDVAIIDWRKYS